MGNQHSTVAFDERLFSMLVERGIVLHDGIIEWHFKCEKTYDFRLFVVYDLCIKLVLLIQNEKKD